MTTIHCDGCGQEIPREEDGISIGRGWFPKVQLCASCGAPAAALLQRIDEKILSAKPQPQIEEQLQSAPDAVQ
jgi:hypothetical protein